MYPIVYTATGSFSNRSSSIDERYSALILMSSATSLRPRPSSSLRFFRISPATHSPHVELTAFYYYLLNDFMQAWSRWDICKPLWYHMVYNARDSNYRYRGGDPSRQYLQGFLDS